MNRTLYAALLTCSLALMAGCDQVENSGKQLLDAAADSARQAIDDTHKAATDALHDARQELSVIEPKPKAEPEGEKSTKEI